MTVLLVLGAVGLVGLLVGMLVGDIDLDIDVGPDWVSIPALAALVGAFGFVGAATLSLGAALPLALLAGTVAGIVLAILAVRLVGALMHMPTDSSLRPGDLVGRPGRVVTALTAERTGEVLVSQAGQQLKLAARADESLAVGAAIVVVDVVSPTLVRVEAHERFWSPPPVGSGTEPPSEAGPPPAEDPTPDTGPDGGPHP